MKAIRAIRAFFAITGFPEVVLMRGETMHQQPSVLKLDDMVRGWFVGNFSPAALRTADVEVAVQRFTKGTIESNHYHRQATEVTLLLSGRARMAGLELHAGDIIT
ncbi:hypothetical protein INF70_22365, partial [Enterobacter cloacae complex sp. P4RS]|nr:hypothetical protein [Enterobacter cloacae complex sp. P4RS]